MPIENFTKGSAGQFKNVLAKEPKPQRPATAVPRAKPTKMSNILQFIKVNSSVLRFVVIWNFRFSVKLLGFWFHTC